MFVSLSIQSAICQFRGTLELGIHRAISTILVPISLPYQSCVTVTRSCQIRCCTITQGRLTAHAPQCTFRGLHATRLEERVDEIAGQHFISMRFPASLCHTNEKSGTNVCRVIGSMQQYVKAQCVQLSSLGIYFSYVINVLRPSRLVLCFVQRQMFRCTVVSVVEIGD